VAARMEVLAVTIVLMNSNLKKKKGDRNAEEK
jgi:hypothetical protein